MPSISLNIQLKLLLLGAASAFILSGCTPGRQIVQPYRERPKAPEVPTSYPRPPQQETAPASPSASRIEQQGMSQAEQLAYNRQVLQPIRSTVRGRVSFYAEQVKSWQELERTTSRYRTPEQSRKLLSCQSRVSALHDAYTELQIQLFNYRPETDSREKFVALLQNLQGRDFAYLEGECPALFKQFKQLPDQPELRETPVPVSPPIPSLEATPSQPVPADFSNAPQFQQSLQKEPQETNTDLIPPVEPSQNYEERYQQAQSLLKQGREQEARSMLSDLLASVRRAGNRALQIKVLKKISEVEFALRNYLPARILYEELRQLDPSFDLQHLAALQNVDTRREEVDTYAALLLSSFTSDPERDGFTVVQQAEAFMQTYPGSFLHANAEKLAGRAEQEAEQWFRGLLRQSDQLAASSRRAEALALLERVPLDILPLDKQDIIQQKKNSLAVPVPAQTEFNIPVPAPLPVPAQPELHVPVPVPSPVPAKTEFHVPVPAPAQTDFPPPSTLVIKPIKPTPQPSPPQASRGKTGVAGPEAVGQPDTATQKEERRPFENKEKKSLPSGQTADTALQKKWNKAEAAFQAAEYDKAIALFTDLQNTSLDAKARRKMEKASLAAGQEARKKAANFFQRANNATDPEVRKQHLLSSRMLLEDILRKYPLAGLDDKVKRNISRVDKELAALDRTPFN